MTPTLFSMILPVRLTDFFLQDSTEYWFYNQVPRFYSKLLNLRKSQAKTKVQTDVLDELRNADGVDQNSSSQVKCK